MRAHYRFRPYLLPTYVVSGVLLTVYGSFLFMSRGPALDQPDASMVAADDDEHRIDVSQVRPQVETFCGNCHATPDPGTFPREAWYAEVRQGYEFYYESLRNDLKPPPMPDVVAYYRALSSPKLAFPPSAESKPSPIRLTPEHVSLNSDQSAAGVSHLKWAAADGGEERLLVCDMETGVLGEIKFAGKTPAPRIIAQLDHPAHVEPAALGESTGNGLLAADLGSRLPADHERGRVVWIGAGDETAPGAPGVLAERLARVADAQAADFDGDGDVDLVAAEFGWRQTGTVTLLRQETAGGGPRFVREVIDDRHGAIHVPVVDLDRDGHLDFVALISQEHEVVDAFLNRGDGTFRRERLFAAGDPSYGSSGIQLVDFDGDGDVDVLHTNGDTLDSRYLKPSHGVRWLENRGGFPFVVHEVAFLPGCMRALAVDLDHDGDRDIVACNFVPPSLRSGTPDAPPIAGLVWFEQRRPDRFIRHDVEVEAGHMSLATGDFDRDGDPDIAAGCFGPADGGDRPWVRLWWNEGSIEAVDADAAAGR